ncbi:hypothetical protein [Dactylosporangium sp. NPDC049140]|jgi:hypothetical protein|uniref:hypothetical protein n=1 Tax=Dactylosporangium sp. NPDC049140 TaxID=3155647 RepID=UPI0033D73940
MERLNTRGRVLRIVAALVFGALTLAGTFWGDDTVFPFAPFRMFSTADDPNEPVLVLRTDGIDTTGRKFELNEDNAGVRRAEIEAQIDRFKADPALLHSVQESFAARNPGRPPLVEVDIVEVQHHLHNAQPTGEITEAVLARYRP